MALNFKAAMAFPERLTLVAMSPAAVDLSLKIGPDFQRT
ncbi:hypothetical protein H4W29_003962 [Rhizobium viscosum]|uniref:Uncharacterized protein n=1 Tax=Rhizobium viscosum TaxID=1673 RepID=A0ABR9IUB4_RHIVS|nr:hypothetical protein [Rhizobium viscosum]